MFASHRPIDDALQFAVEAHLEATGIIAEQMACDICGPLGIFTKTNAWRPAAALEDLLEIVILRWVDNETCTRDRAQ